MPRQKRQTNNIAEDVIGSHMENSLPSTVTGLETIELAEADVYVIALHTLGNFYVFY